MVMANSVEVSRVDQNKQAKSISIIESQNPSLQSIIKIFCAFWRIKMPKHGKRPGQLFLEVGTPMKANILVQVSLLHNGNLKTVSSSLRTAP